MKFKDIMMTSSKVHNYECCMCGDLGVSHELFRCKLCHFRSQHRYCSNLYPKAETYGVCNWCLMIESNTQTQTQTDEYDDAYASNDGSNHLKLVQGQGGPPRSTSNDKQHPYPKRTAGKSQSPKWLQASGPIVKKPRSPEGRKSRQAHQEMKSRSNSKLVMKRSKSMSSSDQENMLMLMLIPSSSSSSSSNSNKSKRNNSTSNNNDRHSPASRNNATGVVRNKYKVRRYKLLDEVSF